MVRALLAYVLAIYAIGCGVNEYNCPEIRNAKNVPNAHRHMMQECTQEVAFVPPEPERAQPAGLRFERPTASVEPEKGTTQAPRASSPELEWEACFDQCVQEACADWHRYCAMPCHTKCGPYP